MSITHTMAGARDSAKQHISESKMDRTTKENVELKAENRLLREELAEDRSERKQVLDLLDRAQASMNGPSKRRFKLMRLVAVGGTVYAVVTKTGAVDRVKEWIDTMKGKTEQVGSDLASKSSEMTHQVGDAIEHTGRKLEQTGESIEQSARKIEE
jgi:hypothetical protein